MLNKRELVYEGGSKRLFSTDRDSLLIMEFKDDFLDQNGTKKSKIPGKGEINAGISSFLFQYLENSHVPTHFVEPAADAELLVRRLKMFPVEVVVHNVASVKLAQRFHLDEGQHLDSPVTEFFLKSPKLGNPQINETHAQAFGYARTEDVKTMSRMAAKANAILKSLFDRRGLLLVEFTLEFGIAGEHICIGDEISPDTCRIWDKKKNRKLDKDRFLQDLGGVEKAYRELFDRLTRAM
jgi:phosphoribosylaminoimidazole-succinocarboxamide synthase